MIAVTKLFISLIKMTVLAHYLTFPIQLQWLIGDYLITSLIFILIVLIDKNHQNRRTP